MASVRKLDRNDPKSPWIVEYTDAVGKRRRKTPKSGLKKDADRIRQEIEREIGDGVHVAHSQTVTFGEIKEIFLKTFEDRQKAGDLSMSTFKRAEADLRLLLSPNILARLVCKLRSQDFQAIIDDIRHKRCRQNLRNFASLLNRIMQLAVTRDWIKINPLKQVPIKFPKRAGSERRRVPTRTELHAVLATLADRKKNDRHRTFITRIGIVSLALFGGLRRGEIVGLQWENIDFEADVIRVRHSLSAYEGLKGPKTAAGVRDVPMAPQIKAALLHLRENRWCDSPYVINSPRGGSMRATQITGHHWPAIMKAAGLVTATGWPQFTFHSLRHAAVSLLIAKGLPAMDIKGIVGHEKVSTTLDIYGHLFPEDDRKREAIYAASSDFSAMSVPVKTTRDRFNRVSRRAIERDRNATSSRSVLVTHQ